MPLNLFGRPLHTGPVDPALLEEANRRLFAQARLDSAPAGSVGAPSGVQPAARAVDRRINPFQAAALASSPIPVLGDVMGLAADAQMYATDPESRTMGNFALSGFGLLPFVPGMTQVRRMLLDDNGKPRTVYHSTMADFEDFDPAKRGINTGARGAEKAFWFSGNPADGSFVEHLDASRGDGVSRRARVIEANLEVENPMILGFEDDSNVPADVLESLLDNDPEALDYALQHGFDAVIWPYGNANNAGYTAAVFDPSKIRRINKNSR